MTASYEIPQSHGAKARFRSKPVDPQRIHVVIPTHDDWDNLKKSLDSLRQLNPAPLRITVVDDNRFKDEPAWFKECLAIDRRIPVVSNLRGRVSL